ncbi:exonuclease domain-containing protein [Stenotrophomonas sp.]|uniref:3'-5' exonuclease n=1 Tax=Stenotrophomonas sp. TaxID=69392 RepID=UPI0028AB6F4E|nr:exonuclease domain-containing protein [Stenotrophomonas sp.]
MLKYDLSDLVVVDTETTGVNPFESDLISIGVCSVSKDFGREFFLNIPGNSAWSEFSRKNFHGFESNWSAGASDPSVVVPQIMDFISECTGGRAAVLVGHNFSFDRMFLQKAFHLSGYGAGVPSISHRSIDTYSLLKVLSICGHIPEWATSSDGAFKYFDVSVSPKLRHTALGDAVATKELFIKIIELFDEVI